MRSPELTLPTPAEFTPPPFQLGEVVNGKVVTDLLVNHEAAAVYACQDEAGELYVMKVAHDETGEEALVEEAALYEEFSMNDAILDVASLEEKDGHAILVTPLQEGGDMKQMIQESAAENPINHEQLDEVIDEIKTEVEFYEQIGADITDDIDPATAGQLKEVLAERQAAKEIALESNNIATEHVIQMVVDAAEDLGETDLDPESFFTQKVALELVEKASHLDEALTHEPTAEKPSEDEIKERLVVLNAIAGAVQALHGEGVLHLDIKEDNIFIDKKGHAKLGDLGSAKKIGESVEGGYSGSADNLPVQAYNQEATVYDETFDAFGLGVVAFKAVTGTRPFSINKDMDQSRAVEILNGRSTNHNLIAERVKEGAISLRLGLLVMRSISPKAEARPTIAELQDAFAA